MQNIESATAEMKNFKYTLYMDLVTPNYELGWRLSG
jgi:hypothetical protein